MVIAWVLVALVLLAFETHHQALYAGCFAIGAFAGAIVAAFHHPLWLQTTVFVVVAFLCAVLIRPYAKKWLDGKIPSMQTKSVGTGMIGQVHSATDEIGDLHNPGHVTIGAEQWLAFTESGTIAPTTRVIVTAIVGSKLKVEPAEQ